MPQYIMPGKQAPEFQSLDAFTQGYIEAMLWTEEENLAAESETLESSGVALAKTPEGIESFHVPGNIGFELIAPEALEKIIADCKAFQEKNADNLKLASAISCGGYELDQAGHDFWLTRNGHGAGFWDRGLVQAGDALSAACGWRTAFPEVSAYLGDDGKIYLA